MAREAAPRTWPSWSSEKGQREADTMPTHIQTIIKYHRIFIYSQTEHACIIHHVIHIWGCAEVDPRTGVWLGVRGKV